MGKCSSLRKALLSTICVLVVVLMSFATKAFAENDKDYSGDHSEIIEILKEGGFIPTGCELQDNTLLEDDIIVEEADQLFAASETNEDIIAFQTRL